MLFVTISAETSAADAVGGRSTRLFSWENPAARPEEIASSSFVPSPSFCAIVAPGRLFTTSEDDGEGRVSLNDGFLAPSSRPTGGQGAVHCAVDAGNRFIAVANYRAAPCGEDLSVAIFPVEASGQLGERVGQGRNEGSGPDRDRQSSPHTHCVMFSPDNRMLAAVDLGTDGVWLYRFDSASGAIELAREVKLTPGSGPRHCVFHPSRPFLYVCGELDSSLMTLRYDSIAGTAELVDREVATKAPHRDRNYPSGIAISPDGHYVLLANRGADTIAVFWIDPETGHARFRDEVPCGGKFPRAIRLDRTGGILAVANQKSDNVVFFARDFSTGRLTLLPNAEIALPAPMDVIFHVQ